MAPRRRDRAGIGFMILWLVFWTAGILIALWTFGGLVLEGEFGVLLPLGVWLVAAGFGLVSGARRLRQLLLREPVTPRGNPRHRWDDGMAPRPSPSPPGETGTPDGPPPPAP